MTAVEIIITEEDGWFIVECPAMPGCVSQGKSEQEAIANMSEAIALWMQTWFETQAAQHKYVKSPGIRREEVRLRFAVN